jgi:predicted GIY-YIG superfamily endonuclease
MSTLPYVITILVTNGDPDRVRVVEKSNWTGRGVMFARADLGAAREQGLDSPGIYMLLGDDPDEQYDQQIYVGQGDNIGKRLKQHQSDDGKDFWDTTLVFLSGNQSLNRAHVSYLEAELIRLANSAKRARLANGNQPSVPHLPPTDHAVAAGFLDEMRAILPALGVDAFETPDSKPATSTTGSAIRYLLDARGARGEGEERSDGFLVFEGATARHEETPSMKSSGSNRLRNRLIASGQLADESTHYHLTSDTLFKTPSAAAMTLMGGHANGRIEWRDANGVTLKEHQIANAEDPSTNPT